MLDVHRCRCISRLRISFSLFLLLATAPLLYASGRSPLVIGFDGEFGLPGSTSAQSIELGMRLAVDEINQAGGVLDGRPLQLDLRDNRSVPARGEENLRRLVVDNPELIAMVGGRFSPVQLQLLPLIHQYRIPYINAWGSADGITSHNYSPSYTFRVSMRDSDAMPVLIDHLLSKGADSIAIMVPDSGWGVSNLAAAHSHAQANNSFSIVAIERYLYGERSFSSRYDRILAAGANGLVLVANELEGALLVNELASRPVADRMPIASHWGVTGGEFYPRCAEALKRVDFSVIQTFSLDRLQNEQRQHLLERINELAKPRSTGTIDSVVGFGHGYDAVHLIARGLAQSGSDSPQQLRDALERIDSHAGLVRNYAPPFTSDDHDALSREDLFMARFDPQGRLIPGQNLTESTRVESDSSNCTPPCKQ
jgi:branched-chain amino acid transport system substrate-binding protein